MPENLSFDKSKIWNFDQTGFNYEPANLRTLSFKGEWDTILMINSRNKHTHSYTSQPMISRDGKLFPKLLLVTQEPDNGFGPITAVRKYGNIVPMFKFLTMKIAVVVAQMADLLRIRKSTL